jgi:hypothetical protein
MLVSCNFHKNKQITVPQIDIDSSVYVLNLDTIIGDEQPMRLSSIFSKVKTIILETTKESVIGRVRWLQVFDNKIFIMDAKSHGTVLMFDINGKFIRKIGGIGAGPGEYMYADDFTIDPVNKEIYILYSHCHINRYTIDGEFIGAVSFKSGSASIARYIQYHNGKIYTDMNHITDSVDNEYLLQEIDPETGKQTGQFLNLTKYNNGWNEPYWQAQGCGFTARLSGYPKFLHLFTYVIPELNENTIKPFIVLQCKNLATHSDIEATKTKGDAGKRLQTLRTLNKFTLFPNNYAETKNHIFFRCRNENITYWITIDKHTKSIKMAQSFNDLVFLNDNKEGELPQALTPLYVFSSFEGVYECMDVNNYTPFFRILSEGKNLNPNLDKLEDLKKLPEDTNPVIFYYSYE